MGSNEGKDGWCLVYKVWRYGNKYDKEDGFYKEKTLESLGYSVLNRETRNIEVSWNKYWEGDVKILTKY